MPLINRTPATGQKLDVAGLNEITVLIDRSETELTEVALNAWVPGLDGPPHFHDRKEQNFLVTSGHGTVKLGDETFAAAPGSFFYVPAGMIHQTITQGDSPLVYFLFNAFLDTDKEGHASFADHIAKVKETRRQQAAQQSAESATDKASPRTTPTHKGKRVDLNTLGGSAAPILLRTETARCEALIWKLAASEGAQVAADATKEQTLFVTAGSGTIRVGAETVQVQSGNTLLVPRDTTAAFTADSYGMQVVSFGTVVVH